MSYFNHSELNLLRKQYETINPMGSSLSDFDSVEPIAKRIGIPTCELEAHFSSKGLNRCASISFDEFIQAASTIKEGKGQIPCTAGTFDQKIIRNHGYKEDTMHTIDQEETAAFTTHVNKVFEKDPILASRLPLDPNSEEIFEALKDGIIFAKMMDRVSPGIVDERALNTGPNLSTFQMCENNNIVINTAKALGMSVVNIGAEDIVEGRSHLMLGILWQAIKLELQSKMDLSRHPELYRLFYKDESLEAFIREGAESNLLRWINYQLEGSGLKPVVDVGVDLRDGRVYTFLLNKLAPDVCDLKALEIEDPEERAKEVLKNAEKLGCLSYLTPQALIKGNPRLNFAFLANLFDSHPGLKSLDEEMLNELDSKLLAAGQNYDREMRSFLMWLNTLFSDGATYMSGFDQLLDGIPILKAFDKVYDGIVDWKKRVNIPNPTLTRFCMLENTNYVVTLGKTVGMSLVGIQGSDIVEGRSIAIKAIIWQLMRAHMLKTLASLCKGKDKISDSDILEWANSTVAAAGYPSRISSFKDPSIKSGIFLLDLLRSLKPGSVKSEMIKKGVLEADQKLNAQYAVSISRKIGATVFTLPDDIIEVRPKMILAFVGVLMLMSKQNKF